MKKYLYNLCVCFISMSVAFQADEALGMNRSKETSQRKESTNSSRDSRKNSGSRSERIADDDEEREENAENFPESKCPCVNKLTRKLGKFIKRNESLSTSKFITELKKYIEGFIEQHDNDTPTKKKLKSREDRESDEEEDKPKKKKLKSKRDREDDKQKSKRKKRSRDEYENEDDEDESWKNEEPKSKRRADASYTIPANFRKYISAYNINLAENSTPTSELSDKINVNDEKNPTEKKENSSVNNKYRINQKDSIKFRQDLEKYRQKYA